MRVPDIIKQAVPLTALGGKAPGQTVYSVLYAEMKKPEPAFKRVDKGTFALADAPPEASPKKGTAKKEQTEAEVTA
jgi:hypothetical protein